MDYTKHYNKLIERAKSRILEGYFETHHIIPKCLGGSNHADNLVNLLPEEHFVAHQLLVKMNPGNGRIIFAAIAMSGKKTGRSTNNKAYGWLKRRLSESKKGKKFTDEHRKKLSDAKKGKIGPNKGKPMSEETKRKISETKSKNPITSWNKGIPMAEETRKKLSDYYRLKREDHS